jgi:hypothetical protein
MEEPLHNPFYTFKYASMLTIILTLNICWSEKKGKPVMLFANSMNIDNLAYSTHLGSRSPQIFFLLLGGSSFPIQMAALVNDEKNTFLVLRVQNLKSFDPGHCEHQIVGKEGPMFNYWCILSTNNGLRGEFAQIFTKYISGISECHLHNELMHIGIHVDIYKTYDIGRKG